jgi:hypothetical protein
MKPAERSPEVDGVLATKVAPVAASAKVISVKVPPTSMARVQVLGMGLAIVGPRAGGGKPTLLCFSAAPTNLAVTSP